MKKGGASGLQLQAENPSWLFTTRATMRWPAAGLHEFASRLT
jgi:hypothetical protein